jgi:hypothetical protein
MIALLARPLARWLLTGAALLLVVLGLRWWIYGLYDRIAGLESQVTEQTELAAGYKAALDRSLVNLRASIDAAEIYSRQTVERVRIEREIVTAIEEVNDETPLPADLLNAAYRLHVAAGSAQTDLLRAGVYGASDAPPPPGFSIVSVGDLLAFAARQNTVIQECHQAYAAVRNQLQALGMLGAPS